MVQYARVALPAARYDALIAELRAALPKLRRRRISPYLDKVRRHAYEVTDEDVQALKDAGHSEDEIFERTVSARPQPVSNGWKRACALSNETRLRRERPRAAGVAGARAHPDAARRGATRRIEDSLLSPELFGRPFSEALDLAMRGPSDWTHGERELFAGFVSSLNLCPF